MKSIKFFGLALKAFLVAAAIPAIHFTRKMGEYGALNSKPFLQLACFILFCLSLIAASIIVLAITLRHIYETAPNHRA